MGSGSPPSVCPGAPWRRAARDRAPHRPPAPLAIRTASPLPPPSEGGQLIFGTEAEEKGFSTTQGTFDTAGILYARTVFDPLAIIDADGRVQPYLAQSITANPDYTVWTITMRPNLVFHNGTPCDGAAVAENFALQQSSGLTGTAFTTITDVSVPAPLVVTVTMKSPWVPFDYYLAGGIGGQIAFIAEPTWLKSGNQTNPIGTGPFVFEVWNPNDHFTATRNPHYWRPNLPYLDSITFRPIPDSEQLLNTLESGGVDMIHTSFSQVTKSLRADTSLGYTDDSVHVAGEPDMLCLLLNSVQAPVRQPQGPPGHGPGGQFGPVLEGHRRRHLSAQQRPLRRGFALFRPDRVPLTRPGPGQAADR